MSSTRKRWRGDRVRARRDRVDQAAQGTLLRLLDTKDWTGWRAIFTDDFHSETSEAGSKMIDGADEFVAFTRKSLRNQATVHQAHAPEMEVTSASTARGGVGARRRCALRSRV